MESHLGKAKICPFIQGASAVNRCSECQLGIRVMSEEKELSFKGSGTDVSGHTHDCAMSVLAGKFAGPMVKSLEGLANVIEGHIEAIEKHLAETIEEQVVGAIKERVTIAVTEAVAKAMKKKGKGGRGESMEE